MNPEVEQMVLDILAKKFGELDLEKKMKVLDSLIPLFNNNEAKANGILNFIAGGIVLSGGSASTSGSVSVPFAIQDSPASRTDKRVFGIGFDTPELKKGKLAEVLTSIIGVERIDHAVPSDWGTSLQYPPMVSDGMINATELITQHLTYDNINFNSFFYGIRYPMVVSSGRIRTGTSVLTDLSGTWNINELAGAMLYIFNNSGSVQEGHIIASNTSNSITITDTFLATGDNYSYTVSRPVYLGSANFPWRRLYVQNDIRFGIGASDTAYPTSGKKVFRLIAESPRALSCEAAFGSKQIQRTVSAGFSITVESGYYLLTASSAVSSSLTTALTSGAFAGQQLILQGSATTNTITINPGANTMLPSQKIISVASDATPIQITTSTNHGYNTGDTITVNVDPAGNPYANGNWVITVVDATHFTLNGSTGHLGYVGFSGFCSPALSINPYTVLSLIWDGTNWVQVSITK